MAERKQVVIFGAGSTGRGHVGQLASASGCELIFVDKNEELVRTLAAAGKYTVRLVGNQIREVTVSGYRVLPLSDGEAVTAAIAGCDLVLTAVLAENLPGVAGPLARGLERRAGQGGAPVDVIACENMIQGSTVLKGYVEKAIAPAYSGYLAERVGFPDAMIARVVPAYTETPLVLDAEDYNEWPVARQAMRGPDPKIDGLHPVENLLAHLERKLFMHNTGHAVCGYLGSLKGYTVMCDAVVDPWIREMTRAAMKESGATLVPRHGFAPDSIDEYREGFFPRVESPLIQDPVARVIRSPLRKLGRNERLTGPACLALGYGMPADHLALGIAALLRYHAADDPEADRLQAALREHGLEHVLRELAGVEPEYVAPLAGLVRAAEGRLPR